MSKRIVAPKLLAALLGAVSLGACSGQSPLMPGSSPSGALATDGSTSAKAGRGVPGSYDLLFFRSGFPGGLQPLPDATLNVNEHLALRAHVSDDTGQPASGGTVSFEYCSVKNAPAPASSCQGGPGRWRHHMTVEVNAEGYSPHVSWGACSSPRSIGFRFRYSSQGSGIAAGTSEPENASWVAGS